ncbi:MAG TPA: type 1 glutamine amidotransferase domain-containing protein [Kofleriaceae bacterium]|nr:type 1 glutamine amidotransferase domain-containing protein [Kofleriaceae bacterium]
MSSQKNRVAIVLTNHAELGTTGKKTGYYLPEAAHAWDVFTRAGYEVVFVSARGGEAPLDPGGRDPNDEASVRFLADPRVQAQTKETKRPDEIDPRELAAIYFAGGHGTMWDFRDAKLGALTAAARDAGAVISAVCHGPAALVDQPWISDQPVAAFSNAEEKLVELDRIVPFLLEDALAKAGARYSKAAPWAAHVVVGDRLVTGQNPASSKGVAEAVVAQCAAARVRA